MLTTYFIISILNLLFIIAGIYLNSDIELGDGIYVFIAVLASLVPGVNFVMLFIFVGSVGYFIMEELC